MIDLHELVISRICTDWKIVATCLNYTQEKIKQIDQAETDCYQCCADLFRDWLSTNDPCSWESLLVVLKQHQRLKAQAWEIENELKQLTK